MDETGLASQSKEGAGRCNNPLLVGGKEGSVSLHDCQGKVAELSLQHQ